MSHSTVQFALGVYSSSSWKLSHQMYEISASPVMERACRSCCSHTFAPVSYRKSNSRAWWRDTRSAWFVILQKGMLCCNKKINKVRFIRVILQLDGSSQGTPAKLCNTAFVTAHTMLRTDPSRMHTGIRTLSYLHSNSWWVPALSATLGSHDGNFRWKASETQRESVWMTALAHGSQCDAWEMLSWQ